MSITQFLCAFAQIAGIIAHKREVALASHFFLESGQGGTHIGDGFEARVKGRVDLEVHALDAIRGDVVADVAKIIIRIQQSEGEQIGRSEINLSEVIDEFLEF